MKPSTLALAAGLVGSALALAIQSARPGVPDEGIGLGSGRILRAGVSRDPSLLSPAFRARLLQVFDAMRAEGFAPLLWEGRRALQRAQELAQRGTGTVNSMHIYGAAADVVDALTHWSAGPRFWESLTRNAEAAGLVAGSRWKRQDSPHVQAVPLSAQAELRASIDPDGFISGVLNGQA